MMNITNIKVEGRPLRNGSVYDASGLNAFTARTKASEPSNPDCKVVSIHLGYFDTRCPKIGGGYSVRGVHGGFIPADSARVERELNAEELSKLKLASGWQVAMHNVK